MRSISPVVGQVKKNPYRLYNYTWLIINEAGDIANATSKIEGSIPWPILRVDLCKLVLGGHNDWGTHLEFLPQEQAIDDPRQVAYTTPGCASLSRRKTLASVLKRWGIYICPGPSHRSHTLNYKCGSAPDYFCASWGCETTGDTYWKPTSDWDLIKVRSRPDYAACASSNQTSKGWYNTLEISFTDAGKKFNWEYTRGAEWGLRIYKNEKDFGVTFKIQLLKNTPSLGSAAIGPNLFLHSSFPKKPSISQTVTLGLPGTTIFQPTLPAGSPFSTELILSLVNASIATIHAANATQYEKCWVCFSPQPPFYEGVATFGSVVTINDSSKLGWHPESHDGLTLSQVSGIGFCLLGPSMLPPQALLEVCNQTIIVEATSRYLGAPNGTYLACSTGLTTYIVTQTFLDDRDYCVVVQLLPKLTVHHAEDLLQF